VINQVLEQFVASRKVPTDIKPVKTAHATTWNTGDGPKARGASKKDDEVPVKKTKKLVKKAKKVVEEDEDEEKPAKKVKKAPKAEEKPAKHKAAMSVLAKIKAKAKKVVEEDDDEDEASDEDIEDAMGSEEIPD
jgi:hypothetical protein